MAIALAHTTISVPSTLKPLRAGSQASQAQLSSSSSRIPQQWPLQRASTGRGRQQQGGKQSARCEAAVLERVAVSTQTQTSDPFKQNLDSELSSLQHGNLTSFEYNQRMQQRMANPYEYHHELGMYYTLITDHLILGSQPQSPADVDQLVQHERVDAIVCLQQPGDAEHWGVDAAAIERRCSSLGVKHYRRSAQDFDGQSLRRELPRIVAVIAHHVARGERVYCHCTAGLGRAPAAVIAFLFWFSERRINLAQAYDTVTSLRPCGPKRDAIRAATYDLAKNSPYQPPFEHLPNFAFEDVADWERELIRERVRGLY